MLTGIHAAFIGGDARQLEVIKKFIELDAAVTLIGFDNWESNFTGAVKRPLSADVLRDVDALILPIVGSDDKGYVESIFCSKPLQLTEELLTVLPSRCCIYTGMARSFLRNMAALHNLSLQEFLNRDDVAIYNSIPTVEGALMMAIQNTDFTIHNSISLVLGLGRVGLSMARVLHALGAHVRVGARKSADLARIFEMGLTPFHIDELSQHVDDADLIFNTIPHLVITAKVIANMQHHALIIDLASKPGGTDFRYAEKRGIKAILAPGLPGIVAPKTAGQITANILSRLVFEQMVNGRNQNGSQG
ncbi:MULTISPECIES: dipicolinate synthase subunit DpsA [Aneurinibacillus]|uniref:Dipicolinate synthase subunit DpsA n=1 Tax=Aneurinibacillus thermoaerophilus TaxID=143495 RepID=A0ABX8Y8Q7_ANETH|nr:MULTISPECIES: dipicolinate synthase subunit DpsA [Aneurinibacillus]AMA72718.1 dipicolinate synthase subunit A [Aneurinibacillus sp. XH2]MED0674559.1 dipicolinate synthase subunit DpsA [Aneurinibacillus thermoaerophilus]MED0677928.1 dipicolinate synthase subunit DpsA [Aneurinibacillus thermoaerophilus]MED0737009.1 dipicolinate synthase subunit DpsA [Aneurinibacillus thermoaerophilus]MED0756850.1 dipicolinate synthase subunit DpsA [Aneurinibacillus thermoaerophilus]